MELTPKIADRIKTEAAREEQRSFYLYDTSPMRAKIEHLKDLMPKSVQIYYAMKANPHPAFLKTAKDSGVKGIEIASLGEGENALAAGYKPDQIIFTGPGKFNKELRWAVEKGIFRVHLESLTEAHRLSQICAELGKTQDVLVRINPNFDIHGSKVKFSGGPSKLGIDENAVEQILPQILALPHLNFLGLHVYSASGVLQVESLLENCRRVFDLARELEARHDGLRCDVIDFGGGFGIDYEETGAEFSPEFYARELQKMITQYEFENREFVLELGRYLTADSGWYCTEIVDIKDSLGKKQIICAGGNNHFRRPVAIGINHPIMIVPMNAPKVFGGQDIVHDEMAFIGGPLCNSADKLAPKDVHIKHAEIGDVLVIGLAGAYGLSMSHHEFLSHPKPPEITLDQ